MNKDFMQYVYRRTEKALTENKEYMKLQRECAEAGKKKLDSLVSDISDQMECKAEELCYLQGFNDAMAILHGKI